MIKENLMKLGMSENTAADFVELMEYESIPSYPINTLDFNLNYTFHTMTGRYILVPDDSDMSPEDKIAEAEFLARVWKKNSERTSE